MKMININTHAPISHIMISLKEKRINLRWNTKRDLTNGEMILLLGKSNTTLLTSQKQNQKTDNKDQNPRTNPNRNQKTKRNDFLHQTNIHHFYLL